MEPLTVNTANHYTMVLHCELDLVQSILYLIWFEAEIL